jgi:parvulin-like peptidyl-prolyl isomerase
MLNILEKLQHEIASQADNALADYPTSTPFSEELLPVLMKYQLLPQLKREMFIDQAIANITCTSEEVTIACQQFFEQNQLKTEGEQEAWLSRHHLSLKDLVELATRQFRLEKFKQMMWGNKLESYFLKRKPQLDRAIYSLIRTQQWHIAQELYFRIQTGEQTFAEVAQEFSQGIEAETGGITGPVELGNLSPTLARQLRVSQPGQLWSPIKIENWVVIVRLEKLLSSQLNEPMCQRLLNELFEQWLQEKMHENV